MPRHADHEERRAELAEAAFRIILEHGIDRVSVRSVAQASGWSVGAIRYYFPRQEELLSYTFRRMYNRAVARIEAAEQQDMSDPLEWSRGIICSIVPINEENRRDMRIWMAFVDRGLSRENIAELMDEIWRGGRFYSRRMVSAMAGLPLPTDINEHLDDPFLEETASVLHVMWNGISFQGIMASEQVGPEELVRLSLRVLTTIFERVRLHQSHPQLVG